MFFDRHDDVEPDQPGADAGVDGVAFRGAASSLHLRARVLDGALRDAVLLRFGDGFREDRIFRRATFLATVD